VQVDDVVGPGDEARIARFRGDEAVEALAEVADDQRVADRGVEQRTIQRPKGRDALAGAARRLVAGRVPRTVGRAERRDGRITRGVQQSLPAQVFGGFARLFQGPGLLPTGGV
jgi:IS5 family transposase